MSSMVRRFSKIRVCRIYRPYFLVAALILTLQLILVIFIYHAGVSNLGLTSTTFKFDTRNKISVLKQDVNEVDTIEFESRHGEWRHSYVEIPNTVKSQVEYATKDSSWPIIKVKDTSVSNSPRNITVTENVITASLNEVISINYSELGIQPKCDIVAKDTLSSLKRAKTLECKNYIMNTSCLYLEGKLYPSRLPRYCNSHGAKRGDYIGCYQDSSLFRAFPNFMGILANVTPDRCIDACLQNGYRFAALESGNNCYCGYDYPATESKVSESECNLPCYGDSTLICGGLERVNVYHTGLKKYLLLLPMDEPAEEEKVRVLYMLTLNGRAVRQVKRLIKALYHVDAYFYIHVDARQDYLYTQLLPLETKFSNIRLARKRSASIWGGATLLEMLLQCMKETLEFSDWHWDFFINLSESDFPIKTHQELIKYLTANREKNFLKSHGRGTQTFITKQGLDQNFVECDYHMWRIGSRELPRGIRIDGGSDWIVINRDFCYYLTHSNNELIKGLMEVYKYTLLGAESFFHTVLRNSEMCNTFMDNNLHVTNWQRDIGCRCQYKHVVDWCGCSPNAFKPKDWARLKNSHSSSLYFARKFEPLINQAIIDQLENWLFGPRPENQLGLSSYWQNEYHINISSPPPDNIFLTAYHSFSRLSISLLDDLTARCKLTANTVLEATLYNENDKFKGTIITFNASISYDKANEVILLETQIRPRSHLQTYELLNPTNRLKSLEVSTNYDHKERILRNFGKIMGPFSEPCLLHEWNSGDEFSATFVWIDPANVVAGSFEVKVDSSAHINFHKPTFQTPLRPGVWTVKFMYHWKTMAETKFLVLPLGFYNGNLISLEQAKLVNNGPDKGYVNHNFENVEKLLGFSDKRLLLEKSWFNSQKTGRKLREWADKLASLHFTVQDTCYVKSSASSSAVACLSMSLDPCEEVSWSTKYPDPKSTITTVNAKTGRLER